MADVCINDLKSSMRHEIETAASEVYGSEDVVKRAFFKQLCTSFLAWTGREDDPPKDPPLLASQQSFINRT